MRKLAGSALLTILALAWFLNPGKPPVSQRGERGLMDEISRERPVGRPRMLPETGPAASRRDAALSPQSDIRDLVLFSLATEREAPGRLFVGLFGRWWAPADGPLAEESTDGRYEKESKLSSAGNSQR
jgi:hypothetical protein